jgi:hypothetical protein
MNHAVVTATKCDSCHNGGYTGEGNNGALGKTSNHIPYTALTGVAIASCATCHTAGYASWNPGKFHSNVSVTTQCANCHLTGAYGLTPKPATATHSTVTGNCENCHKTTSSWAAQYAHAPANAVGTGTCDTCHNGLGGVVGKTPGHIPLAGTTAKCDACHLSQVSFATSLSMKHSAVTAATCKSCHNGSYVTEGTQFGGALGKPANHYPEAANILNGAAMDCNACHTNTTAWSAEVMNHNNSQGNGSGWCKGCHLSGTSFADTLGKLSKKSLTHQATKVNNVAVTDCSQSGCHRPLGNQGTAYKNWN